MLRRTCALVSIAFALSLFSTIGAAATAKRTFVASNGNDANPCSITAPCRGFTAALAQTASGGEILVLDSAGYGPVSINQAVSIIAPPGVYAGISVLSGTGIFVNPGSGTVVLSGLTINGLGGTLGINFQSGTLRIERTTVSGFPSAGLGESLGADAALLIHDSAFIANGFGIFVATSTGIVTVEIDASRFDQNSTGAAFADNVRGTVSGSSFSGNSFVGAFTQPGTSGPNRGTSLRREQIRRERVLTGARRPPRYRGPKSPRRGSSSATCLPLSVSPSSSAAAKSAVNCWTASFPAQQS